MAAVLISRILPVAAVSVHSREPSDVNWTEPTLPTTGIHVMSPPYTETTPILRSAAPPATTVGFPLPMTLIRVPLKDRNSGSPAAPPPPPPRPPRPPPPRAPPASPAVKAIQAPSREKIGAPAVIDPRFVT